MQTVIINITERCNLNCKGCYADKKGRDMSLEDFKTIIQKISKDIETLTFTGGEPFLHPNIYEMIDYAYGMGFKPHIITSGLYYGDIEWERFKGKLEGITVTIKSPKEDYDQYWKTGDYKINTRESAILMLDLCKEEGIPTAINWVMDSKNLHDGREMVILATHSNSILNVLRFMSFSEDTQDFELDDETWNEYACQLKKISKNVDILYPSDCSYQICPAGYARMNILVDGSVTPCLYIGTSVANILKDSYEDVLMFLKIWRDNKFYKPASLKEKVRYYITKNDEHLIRKGCLAKES